jgi:hypothetical protein
MKAKFLDRYKKADNPVLKFLSDLGLFIIPVLEVLVTDPEWAEAKRYIQLALLVFKGIVSFTQPKNTAGIILLVLGSSLLFSSCVTQKRCNQKYPPVIETKYVEKVVEDIRYVPRDSLVIVPADSSWLRAKIQCDSLNNVLITEIECSKGSKSVVNFKFTNGQLSVKCKCDSQAIALKWNEKHVKTTKTTIQTKTVEVKTNFLTGFQWFMYYSGWGLWIVLILFFLYLFINRKFRRWTP